MMQMLMIKNPLFRKGLRLPQRLCYINSMSFWLFPLIRLTYLYVPLVYLFFGIEIFVATFPEVMAYMLQLPRDRLHGSERALQLVTDGPSSRKSTRSRRRPIWPVRCCGPCCARAAPSST